MRLFKLFNTLILFCVLSVFVSAATSNQTISFQGYLTDTNGNMHEGSVNMGFIFYNNITGGTALSNITGANANKEVTVFEGNYTTKIELSAGEIDKITSASDVWIEVSVNGTAMSPRIEMIAAPYAMFVKGIKYDAKNDTVMIGYSSPDIVTANSGKNDKNGDLVVENYIAIGGGAANEGTVYLNSNTVARIDGDVKTNVVTANQVFGAVWN
ncbi:MAG: hypothetical protein LBD62_00060 [Candidatus Margulisbacteria bacterium]|jgi:hypothetical protein|nr:hypothetical protein [Candidatus Margulisiibacteriota bacterium]